MNLYYTFLLAAVTAYLCGLVARGVLGKCGVVDMPNQRSSHDKPVARGGGLGVLFAVGVVGALAAPLRATAGLSWIVSAGFILAAVSFLDDIRSLPQMLRLGVHAGAAVVAMCALDLSGTTELQPLQSGTLAAVSFLWITGYTNAFNFMDGINGMAGMQVLVTGVGTALVAVAAGASTMHPAVILAVTLAGAGAGFLPHNFPRAKMFLGDVGSAPLGFLLAVLALWLARDLGWWLLGAFGMLHTNFVLDTSITLGRRVIRGDNCFASHRDHFYQRLVRAGESHHFVTVWEAVLQALVLGVVLLAMKAGWAWRFAAAGAICAVWVGFFAVSEALFRRRMASAHGP